ncbi:MinD/ParA family ATP-binding protein [Sulfuriferula nivalis]|uniref:Flagellar biosynthesis protein FlhG n=1 Tax=Sulfuriferula nivalis TaxID=2675298 RepID=A0A809RGZ2_9PROT|nr:MinD/ParA family protein [Sulfuriferula nivalis]BBP01139.1 flagellar biosynthesis protein FlhG [Sulfuriferula nivalis]
MANLHIDQAAGLRRMLAGPKPRIVTLLSVLSVAEKNAMLTNLSASFAHLGNDAILIDARHRDGVGARLGRTRRAGLLAVARQECALNEVIQPIQNGFNFASVLGGNAQETHYSEQDKQRLSNVLSVLAQQYGTVIVDAELDSSDSLPVQALADGEVVIHISTSAESIKAGYALIKQLNANLGRRGFGVLVTNAEEEQAQLVYANLAKTASRYLAVPLHFMGSIPADDHLSRAARLGRSVIDAFPMAMASVAFRRIAGQLGIS